MPEHAPTFSAETLSHFGQAVLEAQGTPDDLAAVVTESLVLANLAGHDSHGIMRLRSYVNEVRAGKVVPAARPEVQSRHQATAIVDGQWGWGQPAARLATDIVRSLAAEYGVGAVAVHHCNHIGRLGEYVEMLTLAGMTGIALCNAGLSVAPFGGRAPRLGSNPIAWAAPTATPDHPILLDLATSAVAGGKIEVAGAKGETLAPGLILDADGRPSIQPADYLSGGMLLPFGGHKGYALSVMIDLLGGGLSGAAPSFLPEYEQGNGTLIIAFNIAAFQPLNRFVDQAERYSTALRDTPAAEGSAGVAVPGDPEVAARQHRAVHGIPLPEQTVRDLNELASQVGVPALGARA